MAREDEGRRDPSRSEVRWDVSPATELVLHVLPQPPCALHPMMSALAEPQTATD